MALLADSSPHSTAAHALEYTASGRKVPTKKTRPGRPSPPGRRSGVFRWCGITSSARASLWARCNSPGVQGGTTPDRHYRRRGVIGLVIQFLKPESNSRPGGLVDLALSFPGDRRWHVRVHQGVRRVDNRPQQEYRTRARGPGPARNGCHLHLPGAQANQRASQSAQTVV